MEIEKIFTQTQKKLKQTLYNVLTLSGYSPINQNGFIFAQGEHSVLLVAHLDTVHKDTVRQICYSKDGNIIMSPQGIGGDDRCGVYMILEIVKKIKCSVLFCEDEEKGMIGAEKFVKSKIIPNDINYIIELDRKGCDDAVFYDCDNKEFTEFILEAGFVEDSGSFSDISTIAPHLGLAAVNISSGYYNAHTQHEYVNLSDVKKNIYRISKLLMKDCGKFEYIEKIYVPRHNFDRYGFGHQCKNELNWFDGGYEIDENYKELMLITDEIGYVINEQGFLENCEDFYIDSNHNVYAYDWENDIAYPVTNYQAKRHDGGYIKFDERMSEYICVLDEIIM